MAKQIKIYTTEQKEDIILFVYNMLKGGCSFVFLKERTMEMENDEHHCRILTTMFGDNKEMSCISIKNKITDKTIDLYSGDIKKTPNISSQFDFIQQEVNNVIDLNSPTYYSDDEIEDIIGDPSLLARRSTKVGHLVDNITKKKRFKFR